MTKLVMCYLRAITSTIMHFAILTPDSDFWLLLYFPTMCVFMSFSFSAQM